MVFSRSGFQTTCNNAEVIDKIDTGNILELKSNLVKIFWRAAEIIDQPLGSGLVDTAFFVVHPITGGQGKRLFNSLQLHSPVPLKLTDNTVLPSGAIVLQYQVKKQNILIIQIPYRK